MKTQYLLAVCNLYASAEFPIHTFVLSLFVNIAVESLLLDPQRIAIWLSLILISFLFTRMQWKLDHCCNMPDEHAFQPQKTFRDWRPESYCKPAGCKIDGKAELNGRWKWSGLGWREQELPKQKFVIMLSIFMRKQMPKVWKHFPRVSLIWFSFQRFPTSKTFNSLHDTIEPDIGT